MRWMPGARAFRLHRPSLLPLGLGVACSLPARSGCRSEACLAQQAPQGHFRLVQYNVKGLTTSDGASAVGTIARSLSELKPAIVCLNEVDLRRQPEALEKLAAAIGVPHVHFFGHVGGKYGNALLSRFPIQQVRDVHLDGGTEVEFPPGTGQKRRIRRGLYAVTLAILELTPPVPAAGLDEPQRADQSLEPGGEVLLTVVGTHLDHMDEGQRIVQMKHALDEMRALGATPHLLVGDFNALDSSDYSGSEWANMERKASDNGWTPPRDAACIRLLLREGYADAFRVKNSDPGGQLTPGIAKFTAHTTGPMYRIDYALMSPSAVAAGLRVVDAFVDISSMGSDHFPLVVDLVWTGSATPALRRPEVPSRL